MATDDPLAPTPHLILVDHATLRPCPQCAVHPLLSLPGSPAAGPRGPAERVSPAGSGQPQRPRLRAWPRPLCRCPGTRGTRLAPLSAKGSELPLTPRLRTGREVG